MEKIILKAEKREMAGRKVKRLRKQGILPANIYGKKTESLSIQIDYKEFEKLFKEAGETSLIEINVDKDKRPVLVHHIQKDPVTESMLHVDFVQVSLKEKIEAQVPLEYVGESPAEKQSLGTVVKYEDEITVEALPTDLPENFEVDLSKLENVDDALYVKDLVYDKTKVEVKDDEEKILVKVEPPQEEEELPVAAPVEGEETPAAEEAKEEETEEASS